MSPGLQKQKKQREIYFWIVKSCSFFPILLQFLPQVYTFISFYFLKYNWVHVCGGCVFVCVQCMCIMCSSGGQRTCCRNWVFSGIVLVSNILFRLLTWQQSSLPDESFFQQNYDFFLDMFLQVVFTLYCNKKRNCLIFLTLIPCSKSKQLNVV